MAAVVRLISEDVRAGSTKRLVNRRTTRIGHFNNSGLENRFIKMHLIVASPPSRQNDCNIEAFSNSKVGSIEMSSCF